MISIIIPTRSKADVLPELMKSLQSQCSPEDEMLIIEGSSRGKQLSEGAKKAKNPILFFCHGDSFLAENALDIIRENGLKSMYCGAFTLKFTGNSKVMDLLATLTTLRSKLTKTPYGDQGVFIHKDTLAAMGGFPEESFLEDVEFARQARRHGIHIEILPEIIKTSPKRYQKNGILRQVLTNRLIIFLHLLGVDKKVLKKLYQ